MTPMDWTVVGILAFFFLRGVWKGLSKQVGGLLRLALGFTVATPLSYILAPYLKDHQFLAWGVAWLVIWLGAGLLAWMYSESIEDEPELLITDRVVGGFVGVLTGYIVILALSFIAVSNSDWARDKVLSTRSGQILARTLEAGHVVLPPGAHDRLHPYMHHLDKEDEPAGPHESHQPDEPASPHDPDHAHDPG